MTWEGQRDLPPDWPKLVRQVKQRDHGRCRWTYPHGGRCRKPGIDVDHIDGRNDHRIINLRLLCEDHHAWRTSKQGNDAKAVIREKRRRPAEPHPGRLHG